MKIQQNWLKRSLALLLVVVTLVGLIPTSVFAAATESIKISSYIPGDVNGDGVVDAKDVNLTRRYIAGGYNVTINTYAADVNADGEIDAKDVNLTRRYIAGGYDVELQPALFTVSFYDGDRLIDTLTAVKGQPLGEVPSVEKSSKANAFLAGYFTDPECTQPFYAENPVTSDMKVYAKYEDMGTGETLNFTSFAQMDQTPDISFEVVGVGDPTQAITLEVKDGSDPVELKFEATDGGYIVSAVGGFNEGCSYQLHLADGWTFKDKDNTIRTASFSIDMEEVENLQMSDDIIYIADTEAMKYTVNGNQYDVLTSGLVTEVGGTFNYTGAELLKTGDIICIYVGTHPEERDMDNGSEILDPVVYVKVSNVAGGNVTFSQMSEEDQQELYSVPDNFPIVVSELPGDVTGTVNISGLDEEMYHTMMGEGYDLATARDAVGVGDFVTLYISQESISSQDDLFYGRITDYDPSTGMITYVKTTREAILECMDLYANIGLSGEDLLTDEEKEELEAQLYAEVDESGFAEDAAYMLADMITKTNGFSGDATLRNLVITDSKGNELSPEQLELLNLGGTFEMGEDIKLTVELINSGDQLHFKDSGSVQLAIGVEAEFEVEINDEDEKLAIELNAAFVQEVAIDPRVKGSIVYKEILWIPIPVGVQVGATIDILSFTAFSFEAVVYTVGPEEKSLWDQFQNMMDDPVESLKTAAGSMGIDPELIKGLDTVDSVLDKIQELEDLAAKAQDTYDQGMGYLEDAADLWSILEKDGLNKESLEKMGEALGQTSITSDLLDMMNLTTETGLSTEYYDGMEALLERYCEMLEQESDWVKLVEQEIFMAEVNVLGIAIGVEVDFVVRADLSLAIGSNLQYQVGKRYEFWFKIGLFKPSAGSSTMDLVDEQFAFQFYVMGRLGLKAGISATFYVGLGSGGFARVGISAELGPYIKMYGFFVYEYTKFRAANTENWVCDERMGGAYFMELGLYFVMGFEASALGGLFEYDYEFLDEEIPLLTAGDQKFYYQPNYEPEEGEMLLVKDVDNNSSNGITMTLPEYTLALDYLDMTGGYMAIESLDYDRYHYTVSNPNFSIDPKTGEISVTIPEGIRYMECDLNITYKYGKMAFSTYDMTVTVPLVWTNLSTAEISEYYTASVRVGNNEDGYTTVWQQRVLKNKEFDLPTVEEIEKLIGWNEYKHEMGTGYGDQQLEDLILIEDEVYDYVIDYDIYSITVNGVQNADGSTGSRTYYAEFGETFDFSDLAQTGTIDYNSGVFTKFTQVTHSVAGLDLSKAIDTRMAEILSKGVTITANYVDDSITATFVFSGIDAEEVTVKLRRGDTPTLREIERIAADYGMAIKEITPVIAPISASTLYQVICGELDTAPATITFVENGGSNVADITKPYGSIIGVLPAPTKTGYTFDGWYTDEALTQLFTETKMPEGGITLYAKWTANQYTVTLQENGGNELAEGTLTVTYGTAYGELPKPERTGYGFIGWFTAATGGNQITAQSIYAIAGNQTLYAQWRELKEISVDVFDFGQQERYTYQRYTSRNPGYMFSPVSGESYTFDDFTFSYIAEGYEDEGYVSEVINSGTWGVKVTRPADDYYAKFEAFYPGVLAIEKGTRNNGSPYVGMKVDFDNYSTEAQGITMIGVRLVAQGYSGCHIVDPDPNLQVRLAAFPHKEAGYSQAPDISTAISISDYTPYPEAADVTMDEITYSQLIYLYDLQPDTMYTVFVEVSGDRNYEDMYFQGFDCDDSSDVALGYLHDHIATKAPIYAWTNFSDTSWYNETDTEFVIDTAAELAGLAKLVSDGTDTFAKKTIKLAADVDLSACIWTPIGTGDNPFHGTFDGQGYTISGMYFNDSSKEYVGLFGIAGPKYEIQLPEGSFLPVTVRVASPTIRNVVIDDSWIYGKSRVGAFVGYGEYVLIENCTNYAFVKAYQLSKGNDYQSCAGGIAGYIYSGTVLNCVNYGTIYSEGRLTGGIVGLTEGTSDVLNNANFGSVTGSSRVGGVVGCMDGGNTATINNYNMGTVRPNDGSNDYIGAIVGRNVDDDGTAWFNYYLKGCAKGGNGKDRYAMGNDGGSVKDGEKDYFASSFTSLTVGMSSTAGKYGTGQILINALNAGAQGENPDLLSAWEATGPDGYPLPVGTFTSALRK